MFTNLQLLIIVASVIFAVPIFYTLKFIGKLLIQIIGKILLGLLLVFVYTLIQVINFIFDGI